MVDVLSNDPIWAEPSTSALERASAQGPVAINDIIYAELSPFYDQMAALEAALNRTAVHRLRIPPLALFYAGQAFRAYRRRGGPRESLLPDFLIGAHALVEDYSVLTRDPTKIRTYFPTVTIIAP